MSKRTKKFAATFLSFLMLTLILICNSVKAKAESIYVISTEPEVFILTPGETKTVKVPIRSVGGTIDSPVIIADTKGTPYTVTQPVLRTDGYELPFNKIYEYLDQYVEFNVTVDETAKIGIYKITLHIYGRDNNTYDQVAADLEITTQIQEEKAPAQLAIYDISYKNAVIGDKMTLSFTVRNEGEITARNVYVSVDYGDTGMVAGYATKNIKVKDIASQKDVKVELPIKVLTKAKPGLNVLKVNLSHKTDDGTTVPESQDIYITLSENEKAPNLILDSFNYNENLKPGDSLGLVVSIKNDGQTTAYNPRISVDESSLGTSKLIKDYYTDYIELWDIKAGGTYKTEIPLLISKTATGGEKEIKLNLVYYDEQGSEYQSVITIYPQIEAEGVTEDGKPVVLISNVKQSPESPESGKKLTVSFDITNKSSIDLNNFKIFIKNLAGSGFAPVESEPYQYIGKLKAGTTKRISMNLTVTENAVEGLNILSLGYSFEDGEDSIDIPVLNVKNELGSASKPKLIISHYETDKEEIKAGSVFNFSFEIRNTHSSVAAKNIIITVSGKDKSGQSEIFSVTQGSNSFFVSKIGPGETYSNTLEMKVKTDAATMAYPLTVTIDYEYDGIKPNPTTGEIGETVTHELNIQVMENARPVVNNVDVYSYDGMVSVGNPANLSFEFYNMGKSALNNVMATVEGDFIMSGGDMYYLGNVNAGDTAFAEMEVIPNIEGNAKGTVKITYEDSNGNEHVYTKEFETFVNGAQSWDPGLDTGGVDVFNPTVPEPKKPILPVWAFILIQIAIFAVFVPLSRKVIITVYKNKLRKKEEESL